MSQSKYNIPKNWNLPFTIMIVDEKNATSYHAVHVLEPVNNPTCQSQSKICQICVLINFLNVIIVSYVSVPIHLR